MNFVSMQQKNSPYVSSVLVTTQQNRQQITNKSDTLYNINLNAMKGELRSILTALVEARPNDKYFVEWLTNDGWKNNGNITNNINSLMADPSVKQYKRSGEENNDLLGKEIYGTRISAFVAGDANANMRVGQMPRSG